MIERVYLDTSAIVKLVLDEPQSVLTHGVFTSAHFKATATISRVETRSAIARALRSARPRERGAALSKLAGIIDGLVFVAVDDQVIELAGRLAERHFLRGYDAVQLAAAMSVSIDDPAVLLTWDRQLTKAGLAEGLRCPA